MANPDRTIWADMLSHLRRHHAEICRQWFEEIEPAGASDGVFRLLVRKPVHHRYLERSCAGQFTEAAQAVTGRLLAVRFVSPEQELAERAPSLNGHVESKPARAAYRPSEPEPARDDAPLLVPDYTFEHFVEGPENRLAVAAAKAVARDPGGAYNPLFIHGGVGLGKTHLLQAICLRILDASPDASIHYASCEAFTTDFLQSVEAGRMKEFRHRFRHVDLLVIDDIHFLSERDKTQEEFFHTFNTLYQSGKQIVLSSDAPPHEIPDLEARLVSRFQSGLVAPVGMPGPETRMQIVVKKALLRGLRFPDDAAAFVADAVQSNIRELEGAISSVQALHETERRPIDAELAREALGDTGDPELRREITIEKIIQVVTDHYGVRLGDLQSKRRHKSVAHPRQVCMYLARRHTRYSLEETGGYFGGRDHTTVMHAVRQIERKRDESTDLDRVLSGLERRLGAVPVGAEGGAPAA